MTQQRRDLLTALVDLRSDTVTRPTPEMRKAMAGAEVGDSAYGEDPTVNALEAAFAERVGKESAVFLPSGTMGNQLAIAVLSARGTEVVAGQSQHVVAFENAAAAFNSGVQMHPLPDHTGEVRADDVRGVLDGSENHRPSVSLVCIENTHMASGGLATGPAAIEAVGVVTQAREVPLHLDGARLFNAEVATSTSVARLARPATTVMCCLSKGLCAPVGSMLAGPAEVIARARRYQKLLGGVMRQAGILAAAGLVALEQMPQRLHEDHARAAALAEAVGKRWPARPVPGSPAVTPTNIVVFGHSDTSALLAHLHSRGVLAGTVGAGQVRLVTHYDVDDAGLERALAAIESAP
ncbi:MAG: GntG family PLP-dependent aldolase [Acidimicrobiales bacterium]